LSIRIFYDDVGYRLRGWRKAAKLFRKVIREENRIPGDLNFIIAGDEYIRSINIEFLKHNYYTDVITFDNSSGNLTSGEIYISIDTVRNNASDYKVNLNDELLRVMIHGVLHLCGYNDATVDERAGMRKLEDRWLEEFNKV
jgi:rRNA maturation RNase YbeY